MTTYTWPKFIGAQKWFCAVSENDLGIKMCLHIQENCFRTISSSLDSFGRQIATHKGQVSAFLRYIEISRIWWKNRKSTFFWLFQTFLHFVAVYINCTDLQSSKYDPLECVDWFWRLIEIPVTLRNFSEPPKVLLTYMWVAKVPPKIAHIYCYQNFFSLKNGSLRSRNTIWIPNCVSTFRRNI